MIVKNGYVVALHFKMTNEHGEVLDQSVDGQPLNYLHGGEGILPALGLELAGMSAGDRFDVTIPVDDAFGEYQQDLVRTFPRASMSNVDKIEVGMQMMATSPSGEQSVAVVKSCNDENVTLDFNHPLAGMTLRFSGTVDSVRPATDEEKTLGTPL